MDTHEGQIPQQSTENTAMMATRSTAAFEEPEAGAIPGGTPHLHDFHKAHDILDAIAMMGLSFKYPQGVDSPASLWSMLEGKTCAMTEWPKDRMNLDALYYRDEDRDERVRHSRRSTWASVSQSYKS